MRRTNCGSDYCHLDDKETSGVTIIQNGEIPDREKIVRGVKKSDSPLLKGYQIYHNYMRPHMALEGRTPAEKAGIEIKGEDKWLTLIQNASKRREAKA